MEQETGVGVGAAYTRSPKGTRILLASSEQLGTELLP